MLWPVDPPSDSSTPVLYGSIYIDVRAALSRHLGGDVWFWFKTESHSLTCPTSKPGSPPDVNLHPYKPATHISCWKPGAPGSGAVNPKEGKGLQSSKACIFHSARTSPPCSLLSWLGSEANVYLVPGIQEGTLLALATRSKIPSEPILFLLVKPIPWAVLQFLLQFLQWFIYKFVSSPSQSFGGKSPCPNHSFFKKPVPEHPLWWDVHGYKDSRTVFESRTLGKGPPLLGSLLVVDEWMNALIKIMTYQASLVAQW